MTENGLLESIIDPLGSADTAEGIFGADEVADWLPGALDMFIKNGLLRRAQPARVIECRGCEWKDELYPVRLDWSPCTYGGRRAWFLCLAAGCGRRVAILYRGGIFACRHCYRLAYPCQREIDDDRAARRADTIRRRLGWEPGILNDEGGKPKGMHWRTFERLHAEQNDFVNASLAGLVQRFKMKFPGME